MSLAKAAVVIVHGLWLPGTEMLLMRRRLEAAGFAAHVFRYRSVRRGLAANALRLAEFVAGLPRGTVHMVGHSLGGVLILETLGRHAFVTPGRVVCLGSPLTGSRTATRLAGLPGGRRMIGQGMQDLLDRGGLAPCGAGHEVGIIAGSFSLGFGRLLGGLAVPNDGTVAVEETRLRGATDHIVLPVSHFALLWSADVNRQILCFLDRGRFCHAP